MHPIHGFTVTVGDRETRASGRDLRHMLGLPRVGPLPVAGVKARMIQGVLVWVNKAEPSDTEAVRPSHHRIMCRCPTCGRDMAAGRLAEHLRVHRGEPPGQGTIYAHVD